MPSQSKAVFYPSSVLALLNNVRDREYFSKYVPHAVSEVSILLAAVLFCDNKQDSANRDVLLGARREESPVEHPLTKTRATRRSDLDRVDCRERIES